MPDFAELQRVFLEVRQLVALPDNDFSWTSFVDQELALFELDTLIDALRMNRLPVGAEVLFLPTGPLQELAISSGWGDEFIDLANRFDAAKK